MNAKNSLLKFVVLLLLLLIYNGGFAQDSLSARAYDSTVKKNWTKTTLTRRDIMNDTITFYFYHPKTEVFTSVTEYPQKNKSNFEYHYRFDSTGLRRATVLKRRGFAKDLYAVYYFENNVLFYKESHGIPFDQETYLLNKGIHFFKNSIERFNGPRLN